MQAFHIPGAAPLYTNTFLLISDAGHAVVIDPAADAQTYDKILKENNAQLTTILCTHGHYDHVGSAEALRTEWNAKLYCEAADLAGDRMYPLSAADCGYAEGETVSVDELQFTSGTRPAIRPAAWCCCAASISSAAIPCLQAASAVPIWRAAAVHRWPRVCVSWQSCPSRAARRCCPAMASSPPLAMNWTTITSSAALCAATMIYFKE